MREKAYCAPTKKRILWMLLTPVLDQLKAYASGFCNLRVMQAAYNECKSLMAGGPPASRRKKHFALPCKAHLTQNNSPSRS